MATYTIAEAKPKLGALVKQAAAGRTIYLVNGKSLVALVPADSSHDIPAINRKLMASEQSPSAPWVPGDARRLATRILRRKPCPRS
jgi:hypothetical protein